MKGTNPTIHLSPRPCLLHRREGTEASSQATAPRGWTAGIQCHSKIVCMSVTQSLSEYSLKISPCKKTFLQQKRHGLFCCCRSYGGPKAEPMHTPPFPKHFLKCQLPSWLDFFLPSTGCRRTEDFSKSHREKASLILFTAISADSVTATPTETPFNHCEVFQTKEGREETGASAPIKAFAYTFPTWVLKKGNFAKKGILFGNGKNYDCW